MCGWIYEKGIKGTRFADVGRRMGVLLATGLIVGESLFGVLNAGIIVATKDGEWAVVMPDGSGWPAMLAALVAFIALTFGLYAWVRSRSAKV